jgi:CDP-diacylglycerol---glycerol-3-phosphate 3-phosphatidyltransferase
MIGKIQIYIQNTKVFFLNTFRIKLINSNNELNYLREQNSLKIRLLEEYIFNIPNFISYIRVFTLPILIYFAKIFYYHPTINLLITLLSLILIIILSDFLDGIVARKLGQETIYGRYLDPICDKITSLILLLMIVNFFNFPLTIYLLLIGREILGVFIGTFIFFKYNIQGKPNIFGKYGVVVVYLNIVWHTTVFLFPTFLFKVQITNFFNILLILVFSIGGYIYIKEFINISKSSFISKR